MKGIAMTKYLLFINPPKSRQVNAPGSREELACKIVNAVNVGPKLRDQYIAYAIEDPSATWESLKDSVKFTVEIDDTNAALWAEEFLPMIGIAGAIEDAIQNAYLSINNATDEFYQACKSRPLFNDIDVHNYINITNAFDTFSNNTSYSVMHKIEETYAVQTYLHKNP